MCWKKFLQPHGLTLCAVLWCLLWNRNRIYQCLFYDYFLYLVCKYEILHYPKVIKWMSIIVFKIVTVFMFLFRFLCLLELIFVQGVIDGSSFIPSPVIETLDHTGNIYWKVPHLLSGLWGHLCHILNVHICVGLLPHSDSVPLICLSSLGKVPSPNYYMFIVSLSSVFLVASDRRQICIAVNISLVERIFSLCTTMTFPWTVMRLVCICSSILLLHLPPNFIRYVFSLSVHLHTLNITIFDHVINSKRYFSP